MCQRQPRLYLVLAAELGSVSLPGGTGFEGMRGSWRAAEAWHCERSGEAAEELFHQEQLIDSPGSKGSCREGEAPRQEERPGDTSESEAQLQQRLRHSGGTSI